MTNILPDMQCNSPAIQIPIQRVGITDLKIPIYISEKSGGQQHSVADVDIFVDLEATSKGTHMSRLAIGVQKFLNHKLNSDVLKDICEYTRKKCEAKRAEVIYKYPYFIKKIAPVSKEPGLIHCNVIFNMVSKLINEEVLYDFTMSVEVLGTSLCPCSKEISTAGAHNQRSKIKIECSPSDFLWIEDVIDVAEQSVSCQIYSVLKRVDEKYVTEQAYNNPAFVEDIVRQCYYEMIKICHLKWVTVEVRNEESIDYCRSRCKSQW